METLRKCWQLELSNYLPLSFCQIVLPFKNVSVVAHLPSPHPTSYIAPSMSINPGLYKQVLKAAGLEIQILIGLNGFLFHYSPADLLV